MRQLVALEVVVTEWPAGIGPSIGAPIGDQVNVGNELFEFRQTPDFGHDGIPEHTEARRKVAHFFCDDPLREIRVAEICRQKCNVVKLARPLGVRICVNDP